MSVEVPCTRCGNAAAEVTPPQLTAALQLIVGKVGKMIGAGAGALDPSAPIIGMTAPQFAQVFGIRCIACVDSVTAPAVEGESSDSSSASSPQDCDSGVQVVEATYDTAAH